MQRKRKRGIFFTMRRIEKEVVTLKIGICIKCEKVKVLHIDIYAIVSTIVNLYMRQNTFVYTF